jgi:integrase
MSASVVRNILTILGALFNDAVKDSRLRYSPMAGVDIPSVGRKSMVVLKPDEIQGLLTNCEDDRTRLIVKAGILTGMRRGELFAVRWEDIDFQNNVIHVRRALFWKYGKYVRPEEGQQEPYTFVTPKTKTSVREIDLSPELRRNWKAFCAIHTAA